MKTKGVGMDEEKTVNTGGELRCNLLPAVAARILKDAADTPLDHASLDPGLARRKAVDRAHLLVKAKWPNLFRD